MGVTARSTISAVLVLVLVTVLLLLLSAAKFETLLSGMVHGRLGVVAIGIRDAVQGAVDLGIPMAEVRAADALIWRALDADPDIASIDIVDATGAVLFSSGGRRGDQVEPEPVAQGNQRLRLGESVAITNSFGEPIGAVTVSYDAAALDSQLQALVRSLLRHLGLVVVAGSALAALGFSLVMRRESRATARLHGLLGAGAGAAPPPGADELAETLHGATRHVLAIEQELAALEAAAEPPAAPPGSPAG